MIANIWVTNQGLLGRSAIENKKLRDSRIKRTRFFDARPIKMLTLSLQSVKSTPTTDYDLPNGRGCCVSLFDSCVAQYFFVQGETGL